MSYTASSQGAQTNCASVFMATLDTILTAAGFTAETWAPPATVRLVAAPGITTSGLQTIDGVQTVDGDRVLVINNNGAAVQNGIYVVHSGAWDRATDADASGEIYTNLTVSVTAGSSYGGRILYCNATGATPWVPGSSTSTWNTAFAPPLPTMVVYKSPSASNASGSDWYLVLYRTSDTATVVYFSVAEVWDPTRKMVRNYAPSASSTPAAGTFAVNDTVGVAPYSTTLRQVSVSISAAGFQYWVSANTKRVIITTRVGASAYMIYAGLYDDLLAPALSPYPLIVSSFTASASTGTGTGSATREPNTTTNSGYNFFVNLYHPVGLTSDNAAGIYANTLIPGRPTVYSGRVNAVLGAGTSAIGVRGLLKDVLYQTVSGAVAGDTLAVTDAASVTKNYTNMNNAAYWVDQGV